MDKPMRVRWWRIIIWIVAFTVISFGAWLLDIVWFQNHPVVWVSNYSDVVLAIWGIQATIASLTLASTAFILGKIDNSYYGISIKNLLHLSRHFPKVELSFWEKIICSIVLPIVTWFFAILDNITAASLLLIFTVYLATSILVECINVITKSEIYSDWAEQVVNQLVDTIAEPVTENEKKQKEASKKQLRVVIDGISAEVSAEIRHGVNLHESTAYWYLVQLMDHYSGEEMVQFNEQIHAILIEWLKLAINVKSEQNIHTVLWASYPKTLDSRWSATGIDVFMHSYYHGDISASCFQREIDYITKDILQAYDDYTAKALFVLRNTIYYADVDTFAQMIKAVWRSHPYENPEIKSNVLITALAYLYYMAFKEQYMPVEKGRHYLENLRAFSDATILESYGRPMPQTIKDILSDTDLIFDGAGFLLNFFNDRAFNWEYISLGEAKSARLGSDTIEFLTFYCYLFYKRIQQADLSQISLDVLLKMKGYMNKNGIIDDTHSEKYAAFCKWLGKEGEISQANEWFYTSLIQAIKKKMFCEAKDIREKREVWTRKILDMQKDIVKRVSKSALCVDVTQTKEYCVNLRYSDFHLLKDFSEHHEVLGNGQVVQSNIELRLFHQIFCHDMINCCGIKKALDNLEDSITVFEEMIQQMSKKGIHIDKFYNYAFFNRFSYRGIPPIISEKIQTLNSMIQNAGQWETGYRDVAIYVDSTLATIGFCFPSEDFMKVSEELTESELKHVCQNYKTDDGYLFKESSNSIEIPFTEEELIEYLRIAMIKIRYSFPAKLPRQKIGFITYYTD